MDKLQLEGTINSERLNNTAVQQHLQLINHQLSMAKADSRKKQTQIEDLEAENSQLRRLLSRPMEEIAAKNSNFAATYRTHQELIADWMVSQKAFKELAIQFGLRNGLTVEEIHKKGIDTKIDVLEDKHDESHNTNVGDSTMIGPFRESLIKKIQVKVNS